MKITLPLTPNHPVLLPFELQGHISPDTWAHRVATIVAITSYHTRPTPERLWLIIGFVAAVSVPLSLHTVLLRALQQGSSRVIVARCLEAAIFVGIALGFLIPLTVWKSIGRARLTSLLRQWAYEDLVLKGPYQLLPTWKVKSPGMFRNRTTLIILVPLAAQRSPFSHTLSPLDDATYYYPYKSEPGMPRMSVISNIHLPYKKANVV